MLTEHPAATDFPTSLFPVPSKATSLLFVIYITRVTIVFIDLVIVFSLN